MTSHPYIQLIRYKAWADSGLHDVVERNLGRLNSEDTNILGLILDHINVVDRIFQHHLQGLPHEFGAPRSDGPVDFRKLADSTREIDDWYESYVWNLSGRDFKEPIDFVFTSGRPARMTRGEIILHVCLHGTYHRGNAGLLLQKQGIAPNDDRMTDFLEQAA
jgi:uncharacterized damage-inducible protein DinB